MVIGDNDDTVGFTTKFTDNVLLYPATRDGFDIATYHSKCTTNSNINTLFIFQTKSNYVFGGFVQTNMTSSTWLTDPNAFIYSFRRNGTTNFNLLRSGSSTDPISANAFYSGSSYGPLFGGGYDLYICSNSNVTSGSYSNLCHSYECPSMLLIHL